MAPRDPFATTIVALLALAICSTTGLRAEEAPLLRDGDRVVLLGGTFIERMQTHGYLETELTSVLRQKNLTFRNLGWSGDNVLGESRAVFGSVEDGYARLLRDLKLASPSVVLVHYGIVEARDGPPGMKTLSVLPAHYENFDRLTSSTYFFGFSGRNQLPPKKFFARSARDGAAQHPTDWGAAGTQNAEPI